MAPILDSHESAPNGISIGLAVFAHLTHGPNTQTEYRQSTFRATPVTIRPIGHTYALCRRCGLKMHGSMLCLKLKLTLSGVMRSFAELLWTLVYLINIKSIL